MAVRFRALTDIGNAQTFVADHREHIRYCYGLAKWLVWDGKRWSKDDSGEIHRRAKDTAVKMLRGAVGIKDEEKRKLFIRHAMRTQSERSLRALINVAQSETAISVDVDALDSHEWLLNVQNGTVDLRTGKRRPHDRKDLITKLTPVRYDPKAKCPEWHGFLKRITNNNPHLIRFLQKAVGYSLTGSTREQVIFILYGTGANGKSTFLNTVLTLLAEYGQQTPTETLLSKQSGGIPNDIARLKGARFVAAVEAEIGRQLAEVVVKQMTGGDRIAARPLYKEFFEFTPTFKLFLAANHKPQIKGTDLGIWRRIRLVPFSVTIPPEERDKNLTEKLKQELSGILRWAVEGCLLWQREELGMPEVVADATNAYQAEQDEVGDFIEDCCEIEPEAMTPFSKLYGRYVNWCCENGFLNIRPNEFAQALQDRGFPSERNKKLGRFRRGIKLRGDDSMTPVTQFVANFQ